jgi:hypothetical protein
MTVPYKTGKVQSEEGGRPQDVFARLGLQPATVCRLVDLDRTCCPVRAVRQELIKNPAHACVIN